MFGFQSNIQQSTFWQRFLLVYKIPHLKRDRVRHCPNDSDKLQILWSLAFRDLIVSIYRVTFWNIGVSCYDLFLCKSYKLFISWCLNKQIQNYGECFIWLWIFSQGVVQIMKMRVQHVPINLNKMCLVQHSWTFLALFLLISLFRFACGLQIKPGS